MATWLESYKKLPPLQQARVERWIQIQRFVAETLKIDFETWITDYVGGAMEAPFDYSFLEEAAFVGLNLTSETFTKDLDPATAQVARVPIKAQNQMGRLSPEFQARVAERLENYLEAPVPIPPADVATLQKLFPKERLLGRLKRKDFKALQLRRSGNRIELSVKGKEQPLLSMELIGFAAVLNKPIL